MHNNFFFRASFDHKWKNTVLWHSSGFYTTEPIKKPRDAHHPITVLIKEAISMSRYLSFPLIRRQLVVMFIPNILLYTADERLYVMKERFIGLSKQI